MLGGDRGCRGSPASRLHDDRLQRSSCFSHQSPVLGLSQTAELVVSAGTREWTAWCRRRDVDRTPNPDVGVKHVSQTGCGSPRAAVGQLSAKRMGSFPYQSLIAPRKQATVKASRQPRNPQLADCLYANLAKQTTDYSNRIHSAIISAPPLSLPFP